jgi:hypothetical protein
LCLKLFNIEINFLRFKIMKLQAKVLLVMAFMFPITVLQAQVAAVKTNLFYAGYTKTPNLSVEFGAGTRSTVDIGAGYNPWNLAGSETSNKKLVHVLGEVEYRYWFCEKFNGHFVGAHALGAKYNIAEHEIPLLFGKGSKAHRFEGWAAGAGVSYGYQFLLGQHWNLEANFGIGFVKLSYDKFRCEKCSEIEGTFSRDYVGPTKAGISIAYLINK